jgi:hypothetical protein
MVNLDDGVEDDPLAGVGQVGVIEARPPERRPSVPPPTEPQLKFVRDLCEQRGLDVPDLSQYDRKSISTLIGELKAKPPAHPVKIIAVGHVEPPDETAHALSLIQDGVAQYIPAGKYALPNSINAENDHSFWSVWINDDGTRWNVRQIVGPNLEAIAFRQVMNVLHAIGANPEEAMARYGHLIGTCGICSRRLTNEVSRRIGIGPICRKRVGWS